ncbi:hypothetical protein NHQ30_010607 [Ciborinia camelliae]|nr:hypothetical protein NHQ30_010607 [Ciborinia camelliae]
MKFSAVALFFIATLGVQACQYCQCQFADGSNCCLARDDRVKNLDCTAVCSPARRSDGTRWPIQDSNAVDLGTACGAGGRYKCATVFQLVRTQCQSQGRGW